MMDPNTLAGLILIVGIIFGIVVSIPIAVTIGVSTMLAAVPLLGLEQASLVTAQRMFTGINSFPLLAIPLFVLAGVIMNNGGIAGRLVDAAKVLTGRMPASLAQTNIVANSLFGAVSGAAVASAAAVGNVMHGRMVKDGYDKRFAAAVNVAAAPSGMLIPPSNTFIVYSLVSSTSIAALFMAGLIPGIMWVLACMLVVYLYARKQPGRLKSEERVSFTDGMKIIWRAVPSLLMIVIVVGGILGGLFTATESASIAVVYCLILSMVYRTIKIKDLPDILVDASRTTAIVMMLVAVSTALSFVMSFARIPELISDAVLGTTDSTAVVLLIVTIILLLVGTFMDPTPAILIFVPIFLPIVTELGVDPVHFGALVVMALSIGVITPPVGNVLFVGARVARLRIEPVTGKLWPFLIAIVIALFIVVYVPVLSTWLPTTMGLL
ncbi:TRAP transporter large permease [Flaviflexus ciconiae]|uniref:TRAP transporter large permease n=1 Tax=Flaviflexus ciconiae TaxID=2496867 RepID=A0A3Q9G139_9ACTO|nr:TRAP transporter large permease [Flaviflexus ciconiae]AZQ76557.1 TRAP transporter large permease [Flaviflexus ciconiae]